MDKGNVVNVYDGVLFNHKNKWLLAICKNMDRPEGIVLSERSQTEKDKCPMILLIFGIKKQTNKQTWLPQASKRGSQAG